MNVICILDEGYNLIHRFCWGSICRYRTVFAVIYTGPADGNVCLTRTVAPRFFEFTKDLNVPVGQHHRSAANVAEGNGGIICHIEAYAVSFVAEKH